METVLLSTSEQDINKAAEIIKNGGLVGMPTETVYGLGANAMSEDAVKSIFIAKGRPQDNPLIVHISDISMLSPLIRELPEKARESAEKFWPGPFTMVLPKSDIIPDSVSAGLDTVAIRMPSHPIARALISAAGVPIAAPSANTSGKPSPTTAAHVVDDMNGKIDAVIMAGSSEVGLESTVVTFCTTPPRLLRPGGITVEELREIIPDLQIDKAVLSELKAEEKAASPGMKYKHYSPKCEVTLISGSSQDYIDYVNQNPSPSVCALCFEEDIEGLQTDYICYGKKTSGETLAAELFDSLRELDKRGYKTCYAHAPEKTGVGLAVYNRLIRAAAFKVIEL